MSEWKEVKLKEVLEIKYGKDHKKLANGNIPVYGSGGIMRWANQSIYNDESILIPRKGTLSNIMYVNKPFWSVDTMFYTIIKKDLVVPKYLFYQLTEIDFTNMNVGSAVPSMTVDILNDIDIILPPLKEQENIAEVLSSLDDKIDLLQSNNKALEDLAETLFRQWFVEEAEEDWTEKSLNNLFDIGIGRTPPRKEQKWFSTNPKDVKWVSIKDMGHKGVYMYETSEYLTEEAVKFFNIPIIPANTVILSFKMTIGRLGITTERMLSNEAIAHFKVKPENGLYPEYLYLYLKTFKWEQLGSTSSIVEAINSQMIKEMTLRVPPIQLLDRFKNSIEPYFEKIKHNQRQLKKLETLRDTILPKLMSGVVRVEN